MRVGRLDRLITIRRRSDVRNDYGEDIATWQVLKDRVPASRVTVGASERFTNAELIAREQMEFRIRYETAVADLTPRDQIVYPALEDGEIPADNNIYDILSVAELGRQQTLKIIAARRPDV